MINFVCPYLDKKAPNGPKIGFSCKAGVMSNKSSFDDWMPLQLSRNGSDSTTIIVAVKLNCLMSKIEIFRFFVVI